MNPKGTPQNLIPRDRVAALPLATRPICVKLEQDIDAMIRSLPDEERSRWLRRVITDAARRELSQDAADTPQT